MARWIVFAVVALVAAAADLESKRLAHLRVPFQEEVVMIPRYFAIGHIYNEGIVFGKFQGAKKLWLVVSILAVPAIVAIFASVKNPRWILTISLALILGGTLGNLYDRAKFGKVRDFIKFSYDPHHVWPLFNLADAYICAGVMLLLVEMVFFDEKKKQRLKAAAAARSAPAPAPAVVPLLGPPVAETHRFCANCGTPFPARQDQCPKCGIPPSVPQTGGTTPEDDDRPPRGPDPPVAPPGGEPGSSERS